MKTNVVVNMDVAEILRKRGLGTSNATRKYLATTVAKFCDPYVPMQQGTLKNSVQIAPDGSYIQYNTPYAHYQYRGVVMAGRAPKHDTGAQLTYTGAPRRGKQWDKRMMAQRGDEIVADLAKRVGGKPK